MSAYLHSLSIVAPASAAAAVRELFAQYEGGDAASALSCKLSPGGIEPPTHFAAHTVVTEPMRLALVELLNSATVPAGVEYLIVPNTRSGRVLGTSVAGLTVNAASTLLTLADALGLKLIRPSFAQ